MRVCDSVGFTWPLENPAVHALNRRIAAASGTAVGQGEPLQVLRYRPGGEYRPHFDAIPGFANQRVMTMLVWLNEDYEGGETHFPTPGLKLKGRTGDAILFRNTGADGRRDPAAGHAGLPVTAGEKLIASRWIRQRPFEMPGRAAQSSQTKRGSRRRPGPSRDQQSGPRLRRRTGSIQARAPARRPRRASPASPDRALRAR